MRDLLMPDERSEVEHWRQCHATSTKIACPTLIAIIDRLAPKPDPIEAVLADMRDFCANANLSSQREASIIAVYVSRIEQALKERSCK